MSEELEVNKVYEMLEDDDVFQLDSGDTFTVKKFKEIAIKKYQEKLDLRIQIVGQTYQTSLYQPIYPLEVSQETRLLAGTMMWCSSKAGTRCQVIKINSKGWQKGKIIIEVSRDFESGTGQAWVKFCSDEPPESLSPLDEIRQSEEYKKAGQ